MSTQTRSWEHEGIVCGEHGGAAARATGGNVTLPLGPWVMPMMVILAMLCGLSIGLTAFAFTAADNAEREARMLEYYVMELDGKLMAAGIIESKESYSAKKRKE